MQKSFQYQYALECEKIRGLKVTSPDQILASIDRVEAVVLDREQASDPFHL